jgi:hypothetical protein
MNRTPLGTPEYRIPFDPEKNISSSTHGLEAYASKDRQPIVLDLMNVVAAVEYCDRSCRRSIKVWPRLIRLTIPVFELSVWSRQEVRDSFLDVVSFLTGDSWEINFVQNETNPEPVPQSRLSLSPEIKFIIPFSDGIDSMAVAALFEAEYPNSIQRVRVGSIGGAKRRRKGDPVPFTRVPYKLRIPDHTHGESTGRSRGFKFAAISGIAAYLADVDSILVPESGTGIFGSALTTYMHAYPDYRNSPLFFGRVSRFLESLLGISIKFIYPRLWSTKAETILTALHCCPGLEIRNSRSCWMKQNMASHEKKHLQCGLCAACLFRRMSFFHAGIPEKAGSYMRENLEVPEPTQGLPGSLRSAKFLAEYAWAGASLMSDFGRLGTSYETLEIQASLLAPILNQSSSEIFNELLRLIQRHTLEWNEFVGSLGESSYLRCFAVEAN